MTDSNRRPIRILVFCPMGLRSVSGSRIRAQLIIHFLARLGATVIVAAPDLPLSIESAISAFEPLLPEVKVSDQLVAAAKAHGVDVIYSITDGHADQAWDASCSAGVPWVVDLHGLSIVETIELGPRFFGKQFWLRLRE